MCSFVFSFIAFCRYHWGSVWLPHILYEEDDSEGVCGVSGQHPCDYSCVSNFFAELHQCVDIGGYCEATSLLLQGSCACHQGQCYLTIRIRGWGSHSDRGWGQLKPYLHIFMCVVFLFFFRCTFISMTILLLRRPSRMGPRRMMVSLRTGCSRNGLPRPDVWRKPHILVGDLSAAELKKQQRKQKKAQHKAAAQVAGEEKKGMILVS